MTFFLLKCYNLYSADPLKKGGFVGPEIDTFLVDIGNVLIYFDNRKFDQKVANFTGLPFETVNELRKSEIMTVWEQFETSRVLPYDFYNLYRIALMRLVPAKRQTQFSEEFTYSFFREAFGNIFTANLRMCEFVRGLKQKGFKVILVSNSNPIHYDYKRLAAPQIFRNCDAFALSHEVGVRKPMPDMWRLAVGWSDTSPRNIFVIDDKVINVDSAKELGMNGAVFTDIADLKKDLEEFGLNF